MSLPSSARVAAVRYKPQNSVMKKELSEIAAELFSPRYLIFLDVISFSCNYCFTWENFNFSYICRKNQVGTANETTFLCSPRTTATNTFLNSNIYEQTPKRTKLRNSISRKRKESVDGSMDEPPTRKRLNSS